MYAGSRSPRGPLGGPPEVAERSLQLGGSHACQMEKPMQIVVVGFDVVRPRALKATLLLQGQSQLYLARDRCSHLTVNAQNAVDLRVKHLSPQMGLVLHAYQLRSDSNPLAFASHAAF